MKKAMMLLVCIFMFHFVSITPVAAKETTLNLKEKGKVVDMFTLECTQSDLIEAVNILPWATASFDWDISSGKVKKGGTGFSLETNETVSINATFSPKNADIDFGLIAPDGNFYYLSGSNGNFNRTIRVNQGGYYYFAVRNNSDKTVKVMGFVYY